MTARRFARRGRLSRVSEGILCHRPPLSGRAAISSPPLASPTIARQVALLWPPRDFRYAQGSSDPGCRESSTSTDRRLLPALGRPRGRGDVLHVRQQRAGDPGCGGVRGGAARGGLEPADARGDDAAQSARRDADGAAAAGGDTARGERASRGGGGAEAGSCARSTCRARGAGGGRAAGDGGARSEARRAGRADQQHRGPGPARWTPVRPAAGRPRARASRGWAVRRADSARSASGCTWCADGSGRVDLGRRPSRLRRAARQTVRGMEASAVGVGRRQKRAGRAGRRRGRSTTRRIPSASASTCIWSAVSCSRSSWPIGRRSTRCRSRRNRRSSR